MNSWLNKYVELRIVAVLLTVVLLLLGIKTFGTGPVYTLADGYIHGKNAKISYKGLIWKTHEGWLPIGLNSEGGISKWEFTATTQEVADCISTGKSVRLHYTDNVLLPFRLGQTHQVDKCEIREGN